MPVHSQGEWQSGVMMYLQGDQQTSVGMHQQGEGKQPVHISVIYHICLHLVTLCFSVCAVFIPTGNSRCYSSVI